MMGKRYVSFTLGEDRYCVPLEQVLQIMRMENLIEVPKTPPSVEGAINVRGDIIPVLNLRPRLCAATGGIRRDVDARRRRVVIARLDNRTFGLDVDEVREIVDIDEAGIALDEPPPSRIYPELLAGIARVDGGTLLVLDLPRVLAGSGAELAPRPGDA